MYVYIYIYIFFLMVITYYSRVWINRVRLSILLVVSLTRKMNIPLSPYVPENLVSRDGFSRPVPRQPAHLHTQAGAGAYLRDSSRVPRGRPFMKPPYDIGSVLNLSGHANAYRWRSLPRVRRHRASKPQGSVERVLPWQVTIDQLVCAYFHHIGKKSALYCTLLYLQNRHHIRYTKREAKRPSLTRITSPKLYFVWYRIQVIINQSRV